MKFNIIFACLLSVGFVSGCESKSNKSVEKNANSDEAQLLLDSDIKKYDANTLSSFIYEPIAFDKFTAITNDLVGVTPSKKHDFSLFNADISPYTLLAGICANQGVLYGVKIKSEPTEAVQFRLKATPELTKCIGSNLNKKAPDVTILAISSSTYYEYGNQDPKVRAVLDEVKKDSKITYKELILINHSLVEHTLRENELAVKKEIAEL